MRDASGEEASEVAQAADAASRPRWRRPLLIVALSIAVAAAVAGALQCSPDDREVRRVSSEKAAPTFTVPDLRDETQTIDIRDFRGRPVVLNFWASWCVPCRKEMPAFQAVHGRAGDDVAFLGVNHKDSRDEALALLRETGVRYASGYDPGGRVGDEYGVYGMPMTIFISAEGRIVGTRAGEMSESELVSTIRELFAVPVGRGDKGPMSG